jgi:hypothetical protein
LVLRGERRIGWVGGSDLRRRGRGVPICFFCGLLLDGLGGSEGPEEGVEGLVVEGGDRGVGSVVPILGRSCMRMDRVVQWKERVMDVDWVQEIVSSFEGRYDEIGREGLSRMFGVVMSWFVLRRLNRCYMMLDALDTVPGTIFPTVDLIVQLRWN